MNHDDDTKTYGLYHGYAASETHAIYRAAYMAAGCPPVDVKKGGIRYLRWGKQNNVSLAGLLTLEQWCETNGREVPQFCVFAARGPRGGPHGGAARAAPVPAVPAPAPNPFDNDEWWESAQPKPAYRSATFEAWFDDVWEATAVNLFDAFQQQTQTQTKKRKKRETARFFNDFLSFN